MKNQQFPGFRRPSSNFAAVRTDFQTTPLYYDIDLSVARSLAAGTHLVLPFAANSFYIDQKANTGVATFHFQDDAFAGNTPVTVFSGFIARVPVTQLIVENAAQAGLSMRVIYGVDFDFVPGAGAGVSVLNALNISDQLASNCQMMADLMPLAVGAFQLTNIVLPAANPSGLILRSAKLLMAAGAGGQVSTIIVAAAAAPVGFASQAQQYLIINDQNSTTTVQMREVPVMSRRIPAGWGLYAASSIAAVAAQQNYYYLSFEIL